MTNEELMQRSKNILSSQRVLDAKIFIAPFGEKQEGMDITEVVLEALEKVVEGGLE